tara:strand:- start:379 stop:903 length:525 start_codon:yes stop_codon:yes gene_type:complete
MKFFIIFSIFLSVLLFKTNSYTNETIAYVDMNKILNESKAGVSIRSSLEKVHKSSLDKFKNKEEDFKNKEQKLLSKRNLMKKEEFELKINELRESYKKYQEDKKNRLQEINVKRNKGTEIILKKLQNILATYSNENNISVIVDKRNIIIGKSELDITGPVITKLDKTLPLVKID